MRGKSYALCIILSYSPNVNMRQRIVMRDQCARVQRLSARYRQAVADYRAGHARFLWAIDPQKTERARRRYLRLMKPYRRGRPYPARDE